MPCVKGFQELLQDEERVGWNTGAYHKTLDDRHLLLLCRKYTQDLNRIDPKILASVVPAEFHLQGGLSPPNEVSEEEEEEQGLEDSPANQLAEEAHLYAQFTCTHKIRDFVKEQNSGIPNPFPMIEMIKGALVFSDLSGFSKLCESYVEKFAGTGTNGQSKAAEKLNLVVNSVFALQIALVDEHHGDVVNFAGDAMFVLFEAEDLATAAQRAAACALAMLRETQKRLKDLEARGVDALETQQFIHIGIGSGDIRCMTFGGEFDKAEFVVAGPALTEAKDCGELAQCGEAIISQSVLDLCRVCKPVTAQVSAKLVASVDGLASDTFFVLSALEEPPFLPTQLLRADTYKALRECDNSNGLVEESMRRFVPHSISACIDSGQSPKEAEECRRVTIMFIRLLDIECEPFDYSLAESPVTVQKCILEIYGLLHRYEGTVSRFQIDDKGTVLKIVFGFPLMAHEDDPVRAVHCAIEIRKNLKALTPSIQSCVGIATGTTICGLVGNETRLEYTAVGSAVILAARLMQNANCCILVDEDTLKASSGSAVFEKICSIKVKGRSTKVKVFRPVETERRITKKLAPVRDSNNILGRDIEMSKARLALEQFVDDWIVQGGKGACHAISIHGPPGMGKATVLGRLLGLVMDIRRIKIQVCKASVEAVENKTPYHPWKKILAKILGVEISNKVTPFQHRASVNALNNLLGADTVEHPALNDVLPTAFPQQSGIATDAKQRREKLIEMVTAILNKVVEKDPLIIVMHSTQWCDNSSLALMRHVMANCTGLMFVLTSRTPVSQTHFEEALQTTIMELEPLQETESIELVRQTLGTVEMDRAIEEVVMDRTQGVPLYCVEFARAVKESPKGALSELPDTITGAVLLRIDRLLPAPKLVLKIVAVAGKDVRASLIADVVPAQFADQDDLQAELEYLVSLDILIRDRTGYCIKHEMVQEVVTGFLTFAQKRFLHGRIAAYLASDSASEVSHATLAHHFELAAKGMSEAEIDVPQCKRAIWFLKLAAEDSMKVGDNDDVEKYLARCEALMVMLPVSSDPFDLETALTLTDGNEALLREVLGTFITNSQESIRKVVLALQAAALQWQSDSAGSSPMMSADNSRRGSRCQTPLSTDTDSSSFGEGGLVMRVQEWNARTIEDRKLKGWRETVRFEARSIASAASTLGAVQVSEKAIAIENGCLDGLPADGLGKEVTALAKELHILLTFVKNDFGAHYREVVEDASAPGEPSSSGVAGAQEVGARKGATAEEASWGALVEEMMNDTLFAESS